MMTPRERVKAVIHFEKPDVLPWIEAYYLETILKWIKEGLPIDKVTVVEDAVYYGQVLITPAFKGYNANQYFGSTNIEGLVLPIDFAPIPRFKQITLKQDQQYVDSVNEIGQMVRKRRGTRFQFYNMPMFLGYPVTDRKSWEKYKERLDPTDVRRYPKDWEKDGYMKIFEEFQYGTTLLPMNGFYGFGAQLMGVTNFNLMFYKDPELIHDMAEYWESFVIETMKDAIETLKDRIDLIWWWEDFAEKHGPNISPRIYREFLLSHYKNVTGFLKKNKVDRIMMDSDGNTNVILDLVIEAGITGHWPLEVNSGMDAISLRKKYGNKLFLIGNLDKRALIKGGETMRKEIDSKVPMLKEMGGYLPGVDHDVPPEFSLEVYTEYAEYIKKYLPL